MKLVETSRPSKGRIVVGISVIEKEEQLTALVLLLCQSLVDGLQERTELDLQTLELIIGEDFVNLEDFIAD